MKCSGYSWSLLPQYYDDYGDIIKATLGKAREINKVNSARTMAMALTMIFRELHKDNGRINRQSADFISLKVVHCMRVCVCVRLCVICALCHEYIKYIVI